MTSMASSAAAAATSAASSSNPTGSVSGTASTTSSAAAAAAAVAAGLDGSAFEPPLAFSGHTLDKATKAKVHLENYYSNLITQFQVILAC